MSANYDLNSTQMITLCQNIRRQILTMTTKAGAGHVTSSLSAVEIMVSWLWSGHVNHPNYQQWQNLDPLELNHRLNDNGCDRFLFSKGHASPLFYALFTQLGVLSESQLSTFRDFDSILEGHPTPRFAWTEATTGSLGQGLGIGAGLALALKLKFGFGANLATKSISNSQLNEGNLVSEKANVENLNQNKIPKVFVLLGDSEMAEGSIWESLNLASFYGLDNLIAVVDLNRLGQTGSTQLGWDSQALADKITAFGWQVWQVDGHDLNELSSAYQEITDQLKSNLNSQNKDQKDLNLSNQTGRKPKMIIAKTVKGRGVDFLENQDNWHGKALNQEQLSKALTQI